TSWLRGARPFTWLLNFLPQRWPTISRGFMAIGRVEGEIITFFREHPLSFMVAFTLSLLSWVAMAAEYWLMAYFIGLRMTPWQAVTLLTAVRLAFLMPFPGAVGTLEAAQVWALEAMGLPAALGISLSLLIRGRDLSLALIGLWWSGVGSLKDTKPLTQPFDS
ncbi:MAG: flippase-like domain-containing protein, partial [Anaerolineales bacterium]|nr:flippase-like domain-containing protein [Anaerolineales bacterium]